MRGVSSIEGAVPLDSKPTTTRKTARKATNRPHYANQITAQQEPGRLGYATLHFEEGVFHGLATATSQTSHLYMRVNNQQTFRVPRRGGLKHIESD